MELDFLMIGGQKCGTTSLWQYIRGHPRVYMPESKEVPVFTGQATVSSTYLDRIFADAPQGTLLGKATPDYMVGQPLAPIEVVAERISADLPKVKLIALLRDPVERAISSFMMAVRRGQESRAIDSAFVAALRPEELDKGRSAPGPTDTYVAAGEYGRILAAYRQHFSADQILTLYTSQLADDPGLLLDAVLRFLGLSEGYRPNGLDVHHFRGGSRKLLDPESERLLKEFFTERVLPKMQGSYTLNSRMLAFFFETWNVMPEERRPRPSSEVVIPLRRHFEEDAALLKSLGIDAPWVEEWKRS